MSAPKETRAERDARLKFAKEKDALIREGIFGVLDSVTWVATGHTLVEAWPSEEFAAVVITINEGSHHAFGITPSNAPVRLGTAKTWTAMMDRLAQSPGRVLPRTEAKPPTKY